MKTTGRCRSLTKCHFQTSRVIRFRSELRIPHRRPRFDALRRAFIRLHGPARFHLTCEARCHRRHLDTSGALVMNAFVRERMRSLENKALRGFVARQRRVCRRGHRYGWRYARLSSHGRWIRRNAESVFTNRNSCHSMRRHPVEFAKSTITFGAFSGSNHQVAHGSHARGEVERQMPDGRKSKLRAVDNPRRQPLNLCAVLPLPRG